MRSTVHDIEHRRPHVWLSRAIEHLSWHADDDGAMEAVSILLAAKRQQPVPVDVHAILRGQA